MKVKIINSNDGSLREEVESKYDSVHIWPAKYSVTVALVKAEPEDYLIVQMDADEEIKIHVTDMGSVIIRPQPEEVFE